MEVQIGSGADFTGPRESDPKSDLKYFVITATKSIIVNVETLRKTLDVYKMR